MNIRGCP